MTNKCRLHQQKTVGHLAQIRMIDGKLFSDMYSFPLSLNDIVWLEGFEKLTLSFILYNKNTYCVIDSFDIEVSDFAIFF